nr:aspartyl-phosphate phosphatase Spo0E family protein [Pontibacillus marinus]
MISDIERKRNEMMKLAAEKGFSHPQTVQLSQELDDLLNKLHKQGKKVDCKSVMASLLFCL